MSHKIKTILGVDPGTNILGYAIIQVPSGDNIQLIHYDVIHLQEWKDHQIKLKEIFLQLQEVIEKYQPGEMAIESPFYGKNIQSMLKLGRAQGVAIAAGITMGLVIHEYSPKKIKQSVTGNGNASKQQVAAMVEHLVKKKLAHDFLDSTDALATALCHHFQQGGPKIAGGGTWKKFIAAHPERLLPS